MKPYLALLCAGTLAACGGGGGSSPSTQPTPTTPAITSGTTAGNQYYGWYYNLNNSKPNAVTFDSSNIKKITVEGVEIDLAEVRGLAFNDDWHIRLGGGTSGISGGTSGINMPADVSSYIVYNKSDHLVVGALTKGGNNYAFYNGKFTDAAQMPVSGKALYNVSIGYLTHSGVSDSHAWSSQTLTHAGLTADFGAKKLTGEISRDAEYGGNIAIDADITGSKFASTTGVAAQVEGGFFGPNAAEIGGIFRSGNSVGAFAGKK